jgi:hypothetical protein
MLIMKAILGKTVLGQSGKLPRKDAPAADLPATSRWLRSRVFRLDSHCTDGPAEAGLLPKAAWAAPLMI